MGLQLTGPEGWGSIPRNSIFKKNDFPIVLSTFSMVARLPLDHKFACSRLLHSLVVHYFFIVLSHWLIVDLNPSPNR
jgi:hypothetical protein